MSTHWFPPVLKGMMSLSLPKRFPLSAFLPQLWNEAEELATEHCGYYSDKKQGVVAAFFLSQIYRSWGLTAHRGWARLMLDRRYLVEVPNTPRHRAERAHADADRGLSTHRAPGLPH